MEKSMGKYSINGNELFDRAIDQDLNEIIKAVQALPEKHLWKALILIGGYGRGEGIVYNEAFPFNDYDLILVSKPINGIRLRRLRTQIKKFAEEHFSHLNVHVDLYLHTEKSLKEGPLSLLKYEMRHGNTVLFGEIDNLPPWNIKDVSLDEGARLLLNRGTLLLYNKKRPNKKDFGKYVLKAQLALGDALLLALGKYDVYYETKKEAILACPQFPWIQTHYRQAIDYRNSLNDKILSSLEKEMEETVSQFLVFLYWYESIRLGTLVKTYEENCQALKKQRNYSLKSVLLNGLYFKSLSAVHPRDKLLAELPLFLNGSSSSTLSLDRFFYLRERFA